MRIQFLVGLGAGSRRFGHVTVQVDDVVGDSGDPGVVAPFRHEAVGIRQQSGYRDERINISLYGGDAVLHLHHPWRKLYNGERPRRAVGNQTLEEFAVLAKIGD